MKILQCKIENFGKFSDVSFDFSDGDNVICHENGWGKSTLAAFIRIMFFGFENQNKQDKLINERKRYNPWQGGVYGGSILFEADGKEYIMRRVFGKKEKDDEFELREAGTNLPSDVYTANIGEELFEIDGASFRRTVFISQLDCVTESTDGIHAKLGNLVENTDDINNFQSVYAKLKDTTNKMIPTRKTGSLNKEKTVIAEMENDLRVEESMTRSIREVESLREAQVEKQRNLDAIIQEEQKKQAELSKSLDLSAKKKEYATLQSVCKEAAERLLSCQKAFPDTEHIPSPEQVVQWQELERQCEQYHDALLENQLSPEEWTSFNRVKKLLGDQIPKEEDMEELTDALKEYDELKPRVTGGRFTPQEKTEWEELKERYPNGVPGEEELQNIRDIWDDAQRRRETFTSKRATLDALARMNASRKQTSYLPVLVLALFAVVAGLSLGILVQLAVGAAAAAVFLAMAAFLLFKNRKSSEETEEEDSLLQLQRELETDQEIVQQSLERVNAFFDQYEISRMEGEIRSRLGDLSLDAAKYRGFAVRSGTVGEEEEIRYETLKTSLTSFMRLYYEEGIPEEQWAFTLSGLNEQVRNFRRWEPKVKAYGTAEKSYGDIRQQLEGKLKETGFFIQDPVSMQLQEIRDKVNQYSQAQEAYNAALNRKETFEEKNDIGKLDEMPEPETEDSLAEMHERLTQCLEEKEKIRKVIVDYDSQLQELEEQLDELAALKVEVAERKEKYNQGKKKYDLLLKTMELLQCAKDNLTAKYMGPVQSGFEKYFKMISGREADGYQFDANVNLTVHELGMSRETRFLSDGCRDLAGICTRMALVDAMYEGEKPFVIMDDPFANLDDGKTARALEFLQEISKEYQVIYFTCNGSRAGAD